MPIFSQRDEVRRFFDRSPGDAPTEPWYIFLTYTKGEEVWGIESTVQMDGWRPHDVKRISMSLRHARRFGVRQATWVRLAEWAKKREAKRLVVLALMED